jgi:hypothetical protein
VPKRTLYIKHGKRVKASRTWQAFKAKGILKAVDDLASLDRPTVGYEALSTPDYSNSHSKQWYLDIRSFFRLEQDSGQSGDLQNGPDPQKLSLTASFYL